MASSRSCVNRIRIPGAGRRDVRTRIACVILLLLAAGLIVPGSAETARELLGMTPAVALLDRVMTFHCSFDFGIPVADVADGRAEPLRTEGVVQLVPGRYGQALVAGKGGARLFFPIHDNLTLPRPGAVSVWLSPLSWQMPAETDSRGYLFFVSIPGARGGSFMIERMGFDHRTRRADRLLTGFFNFPGLRNVNAGSGVSKQWRNGEWHLVVVNWDRNGFALSIDGSPFQRRELSRPLSDADFPAERGDATFSLGYPGGPQTLIDEFIIYRRPLTDADVLALFDRRSQATQE